MKYLLFLGFSYVAIHLSAADIVVLDSSTEELEPKDDDVDGPDDQESNKGQSEAESEAAISEEPETKKSPSATQEIYKWTQKGHEQYAKIPAEKLRNWQIWVQELSRGNRAEIMGTNPDTYQPNTYSDLSRRFVLQYPYTEKENQTHIVAPDGQEIIPIEAPKEIVERVAKESAARVAANPSAEGNYIQKPSLRTGDYWNGVWKEHVYSKRALRTAPSGSNNQVLGIIKAEIQPGNEFYDVVASMKKISPRLLYIINEK